MQIETRAIKDVFITALDEFRNREKRATSGYTKASFDSVIRVLENVLIVIARSEKSNEEEFVTNLKNELVKQVVSLEDIEIRRRSSELERQIKEIIEGLEEGQAALMSDKIKYGHLSTKLSQMRSKKQIADNVHVVKRGEKTYLLKR